MRALGNPRLGLSSLLWLLAVVAPLSLEKAKAKGRPGQWAESWRFPCRLSVYCDMWTLPSKQTLLNSFSLFSVLFFCSILLWVLENSRSWTDSFSGHRSEIASYSMAQVGLKPPVASSVRITDVSCHGCLANPFFREIFKEHLAAYVCWDRNVCVHGCVGAGVDHVVR